MSTVRGHDTVDFQPLASIFDPQEVTVGDRWADLRPEWRIVNLEIWPLEHLTISGT